MRLLIYQLHVNVRRAVVRVNPPTGIRCGAGEKGPVRGSLAPARAPQVSCYGRLARSAAMLVSGPCPVCTTVESGRAKSFARMEATIMS